MLTEKKILEMAAAKGRIATNDITAAFKVSRQYANSLIRRLVAAHKLLKIGATRKAFYILPEYFNRYQDTLSTHYKKTFKDSFLEEHRVLSEIENKIPLFNKLSENICSIFTYAFSEMFNNAIEHSKSRNIEAEVTVHAGRLSFVINDFGVGVFRSVMLKKKLPSELEAIREILKGKVTTMPRSHSGEGIFFTSRAGDKLILDSYGYRLIFDNTLPEADVFIQSLERIKKGTKVFFEISLQSNRHLQDVFNKYANLEEDSDYGFDKTEIRVKLYTIGGVHVSRSQARRVLSGLEKFKIIVFDYDKVPMVGQAFADEIYRVFHKKHPQIKIEEINMGESVRFMVERAKTEARRAQ